MHVVHSVGFAFGGGFGYTYLTRAQLYELHCEWRPTVDHKVRIPKNKQNKRSTLLLLLLLLKHEESFLAISEWIPNMWPVSHVLLQHVVFVFVHRMCRPRNLYQVLSYIARPQLLVRATIERFPPARATFRSVLASESQWLQPLLVLTVRWWPGTVSVGELIVKKVKPLHPFPTIRIPSKGGCFVIEGDFLCLLSSSSMNVFDLMGKTSHVPSGILPRITTFWSIHDVPHSTSRFTINMSLFFLDTNAADDRQTQRFATIWGPNQPCQPI